MLKYIILTLFITFTLFFKSICIYFIELYTSHLLEQKVKVTSLEFNPIKADGYIKDKNNTITIKVLNLKPLKAVANYKGDIDAFSIYQPLKGYATATANINYNNSFKLDGNLSLFNSDTKVYVDEVFDGWHVHSDIKHLSLKSLQTQNNNISDINGSINIKLNYISSIDNLLINSHFDIDKFKNIKLDINSTIKRNFIYANSDITYDKKHLNIDKIKFDKKDFSTYFHSSTFGGDLEVKLKNKLLLYDAKALHLSKVFKFAGEKPHARGYLYFKGKYDLNSSSGDMKFHSPKILNNPLTFSAYFNYKKLLNLKIKTNSFKTDTNIKLATDFKKINFKLHSNIKDKKTKLSMDGYYKLKENILISDYKAISFINNHKLNFNGDVKYHKDVDITLKHKKLNLTAKYHIKKQTYIANIKNLDLDEILKVADKKIDLKGVANVKIKGDLKELNFKAYTDAKLYKNDLKLIANGDFNIISKTLQTHFTSSSPLKNKSLKLNGDLKFDKKLSMKITSNIFRSNTIFLLKNKHFTLNAKNINLNLLSKSIFKEKEFFGNLDIKATGNADEINFKIYVPILRASTKLGEIDNYLMVNLDAKYKNNYLNVKNILTLHHKKEQLPTIIKANIHLKQPYEIKASMINKKDKILIKSFSYDKGEIKSDFSINIKNMNRYKLLTPYPMYGSLIVNGDYTDTLNIYTKSFGGDIKITLKNRKLDAKLKDVDVVKVTNFVSKKDIFTKGNINGTLHYDLKNKQATTQLALKEGSLQGIDIDKELSMIKDTMGLNVLNLSKSFITNIQTKTNNQTKIKHLELDLSLKNKNIYLDDVALASKHFLIVALGNLKENGDIKKLSINLVDKNGCAILSQKLKGNITDPKTSNKALTMVDVVKSVPASIIGTGKSIIDFGSSSIDKTTNYGVETIFGRNKKVSVMSKVSSGSDFLLDKTSKIIMPMGCKSIYHGKVKHPKD